MRKGACALLVTFAAALSAGEQGKSSSTSASGLPADAAPLYRVTFERRDAVAGISATGAFTLPFGCTIDGTIFIDFVSGVPANSGLPPQPPIPPPALLTSISPVGTGQTSGSTRCPSFIFQAKSIITRRNRT